MILLLFFDLPKAILLLSLVNDFTDAIPYGDWPNWGGNIQNQQTAPNKSLITSSNIKQVSNNKLCQYVQQYPPNYDQLTDNDPTYGMYGFIATDVGSNNAFFGDYSGFITSINLNDCTVNWKVFIPNVTNSDVKYMASKNGVSLYKDKYGRKAVLVGGPNWGGFPKECYLLSLNQSNGAVLWMKSLTVDGSPNICQNHGYIVDGQYAYGGIFPYSGCHFPQFGGNCTYRGTVIKIDLDNDGEIVDKWYALPEITSDMINNNEYYWGAATWNYPAIIGDYLIVGTGNLYGNPFSINQCISYNTPAPSKAQARNSENACGVSLPEFPHWRCFENDVYADAINIFKKSSDSTSEKLLHIKSIPLQGNDVYNSRCSVYDPSNFDPIECGGGGTINAVGSDSDAIAQAAYIYNNQIYSAFLQKSGMFWVFTIPQGELVIAKKIGKPGNFGGGLFSLAVDETTMTAIATMTGMYTANRNRMADGQYVCGGGWVEAIDLTTGYTKWQLVNPYSTIGENCTIVKYPIPDWSEIRGGPPCSRAFNGSAMANASYTVPNKFVHYPPKIGNVIDSHNRAIFLSPVTIANDLVFIPSGSGDLWIAHIDNGTVIDTIRCPEEFNATTGQYNRAGFASGVTVVRDRLIIYCGDGNYANPQYTNGRTLFSYKLPSTLESEESSQIHIYIIIGSIVLLIFIVIGVYIIMRKQRVKTTVNITEMEMNKIGNTENDQLNVPETVENQQDKTELIEIEQITHDSQTE
eukprot:462778_1